MWENVYTNLSGFVTWLLNFIKDLAIVVGVIVLFVTIHGLIKALKQRRKNGKKQNDDKMS